MPKEKSVIKIMCSGLSENQYVPKRLKRKDVLKRDRLFKRKGFTGEWDDVDWSENMAS